MPRTLLAPLTDLSILAPRDFENPTEIELKELRSGVLELLLELHCECVGAHNKRIRDLDWEKDIRQLVERTIPHTIYNTQTSGLLVTETVTIKIVTLQAEVDDNGEICVWNYEES